MLTYYTHDKDITEFRINFKSACELYLESLAGCHHARAISCGEDTSTWSLGAPALGQFVWEINAGGRGIRFHGEVLFSRYY